jgi:hypothetical protein
MNPASLVHCYRSSECQVEELQFGWTGVSWNRWAVGQSWKIRWAWSA